MVSANKTYKVYYILATFLSRIKTEGWV